MRPIRAFLARGLFSVVLKTLESQSRPVTMRCAIFKPHLLTDESTITFVMLLALIRGSFYRPHISFDADNGGLGYPHMGSPSRTIESAN